MLHCDSSARGHEEQPVPHAPTIILPIGDVIRRVGLSRSTIYDLLRKGNFPPPVPLSENRVGWLEHEVEAWIAERVRSRSTRRP